MNHLDILRRPRRLRRTAALRALVRETTLQPDRLVLPLFVVDGVNRRAPIEAIPGHARLSPELAAAECEVSMELGVQAFAIFPAVESKFKSDDAREAVHAGNLVCRAVAAIKRAAPEACV